MPLHIPHRLPVLVTLATLQLAQPPHAAAIRARELKSHVATLASDEYEGRETGAKGSAMASLHVARELQSYGLTPLPGRAEMFVSYELEASGFDGEKSSAETCPSRVTEMPALSAWLACPFVGVEET